MVVALVFRICSRRQTVVLTSTDPEGCLAFAIGGTVHSMSPLSPDPEKAT